MKRIRFGLFVFFAGLICFSFSASAFAASPPTLFFTDLESGPKTGGENGNGAFVTLYGNNFGTSPTVTVGGGQAIIKLAPVTYLWYQKMTIQLGASAATGNIVVTNSNGSSNGLPFTVRSGNIYFVATTGSDSAAGTFAAPWKTLGYAQGAIAAGDIIYARNGVIATNDGAVYNAALILGTAGTTDNVKAFVAYPGETATIGSVSGQDRGLMLCNGLSACSNGSYWVVSNFVLRGATFSILNRGNGHNRFVGNDISCPNGDGAAACVEVVDSGYVDMYGNHVHDVGNSSSQKMYHAIYYSSGANSSHETLAWNSIHDVLGCRGFQIHVDGGPAMTDLHFHDNMVYNIRCDGVNFSTVNPDAGVVEAYNNVIYNAGKGPDPSDGTSSYTCFRVQGSATSASVDLFNNTLYNCGSGGSDSSTQGAYNIYIKTRLRNNVVLQANGKPYYASASYSCSTLSGQNNIYFGSSLLTCANVTGNINANPLFVSTSIPDFHLQSSSPAIGAGTAISGLLYDIEGYPRAIPLDLGAYNYGTYTPDTTPPVLPANFNLAANATNQSSITVSWNPATDNVGVTGYIVERCQGNGCSTFTQVGTPTASPFVDSGLTASTFYNYHVRAVDGAGNPSGWSNVVGATTQAPDTANPTAPASLTATASSSSTINLTWTASTDNVGVTGYKVERCQGASCTTFTQVGTPSTNSFSDSGLSASTLYRYQVRATDAAGNNSSYSNIASATTTQAPPTPTFVAEYETAWNSATSPKTTANFSVQTGDILVAYAVNESSGSTIDTPPAGTLTGTWTLKQTISATNFTYLRLWTMQVASNQTNVNVSFTNGSGNFGADVLHFRNASSVGITAQANSATGNPTLTLNGISDNSTIVMVNGDWSAKTGARTYNTTQAGSFTETSAYADGSTYGVEAGYYGNAGTSGNKTIGITAPTGMAWALAAIEIKGNPTTQSQSCNTVTTTNFSQAAYNAYGAPFDAFQTSTNLLDAKCTSSDTHTINLTTGITGDTTRIVYTKGYYYDPVTTGWTQYSGTCNGALNGEWCQGSVSATIASPNISTASAANPTYVVGMTCSVQGGSWKCGCRDATCSNFYWQVQGAGM